MKNATCQLQDLPSKQLGLPRTVWIVLVAAIIRLAQCSSPDQNFTAEPVLPLPSKPPNGAKASPNFLELLLLNESNHQTQENNSISNTSRSFLEQDSNQKDDDYDDYDDDDDDEDTTDLENGDALTKALNPRSENGTFPDSSELHNSETDQEILGRPIVEGDSKNETQAGPEGREIDYETYDYGSDASVPLYETYPYPYEVGTEIVREVRFKVPRKQNRKKSRKGKKRRTRKLPPVEPLPIPKTKTRKYSTRKRTTRAPSVSKNRRLNPTKSRQRLLNDKKPRLPSITSQNTGSGRRRVALPERQYHPIPVDSRSPSANFPVSSSRVYTNSPLQNPHINSDSWQNQNLYFEQRGSLASDFSPQYQETYPTEDFTTPQKNLDSNPLFPNHRKLPTYYQVQGVENKITEGEPSSPFYDDGPYKSGIVFLKTALPETSQEQDYVNHEISDRDGFDDNRYDLDAEKYINTDRSNWHLKDLPKQTSIHPGVRANYSPWSTGQTPNYKYVPKTGEISSMPKVRLNLSPDASLGGFYAEFLLNFASDKQSEPVNNNQPPPGIQPNQFDFYQPHGSDSQYRPIYFQVDPNIHAHGGSYLRGNEAIKNDANTEYRQENDHEILKTRAR